MAENSIIELTADIVSAHVSNNAVATSDLPGLIQSVFSALTNVDEPAVPEAPKKDPAVPIRSSVKHDYIVCLEDGAKLKMLKRYIMTKFQMTPEDYRTKWNLPKDYPMVAPGYAAQRRDLAHKIGLGRKKAPETIVSTPKAVKAKAKAPAIAGESKKRGRPAKVIAPVAEIAESVEI